MPELTETIKSLMRPFIAFSFVMGTIILYLVNRIEAQSILQTTGIIIGFYFGERAALKKSNG
jgi:hypothetical protein